MTKLFAILPALALVVALSGSAMAENGAINSATLNDMGLAGIELMSDEAAMEIRGQGFIVNKSASLAFGLSFAYVGVGGGEGGGGAGAASIDGFLADGKYMAMGSHLSEAVITKTTTKELWVKGVLATKRVRIMSLSVAAGGASSASSL